MKTGWAYHPLRDPFSLKIPVIMEKPGRSCNTYSATIEMKNEVRSPHERRVHDMEDSTRSQSFDCPLMLQVVIDHHGR